MSVPLFMSKGRMITIIRPLDILLHTIPISQTTVPKLVKSKEAENTQLIKTSNDTSAKLQKALESLTTVQVGGSL